MSSGGRTKVRLVMRICMMGATSSSAARGRLEGSLKKVTQSCGGTTHRQTMPPKETHSQKPHHTRGPSRGKKQPNASMAKGRITMPTW
eukprot:scaffold123_cov54-Phaeocystis_antarctica.AAC.1